MESSPSIHLEYFIPALKVMFPVAQNGAHLRSVDAHVEASLQV